MSEAVILYVVLSVFFFLFTDHSFKYLLYSFAWPLVLIHVLLVALEDE